MNKRRGFTLIELLVVIAIIGVLSSVVLVSVNAARIKARDTQRIAEIKQVQTALEAYYAEHGSYPQSYQITGADGCTPNYNIVSTDPCLWGAFEKALAPYMSSIPLDPVNNSKYYYYYFSGYYGPIGQWYYVTYTLEDPNNPVEQTDGAYSWGCQGYYMDSPTRIELGKLNCPTPS